MKNLHIFQISIIYCVAVFLCNNYYWIFISVYWAWEMQRKQLDELAKRAVKRSIVVIFI